MKEIKKHWTKWLYWFLFAVAVITVYKTLDSFNDVMGFFSNLISVITPFLAGILIAYLFYIPARSIEGFYKKSKFKLIGKKARFLSIFTVYLIAVILIIIAVNVIFPIILDSVIDLAGNLQGYYISAMDKFNNLPENSIIKSESVKQVISSIKNIDLTQYINASDISQYAKGILSVATTLIDIFVALVVSIYLLAERREILEFAKKIASAMFNKKTFNNLGKYFNSTNQIFFKFLSSQILDAVVVGVLATIAMSIMGVKYAPLLGFIIGLFNMIPYFGALIAVIISILITMISGGISQAIWMAIVVIILQQIDANIINPRILGNSLKISPLLVIIAVTVGGAYWGVIGMFLAVPIVAALKIIVIDLIDYKLKKKETEEATEAELVDKTEEQ